MYVELGWAPHSAAQVRRNSILRERQGSPTMFAQRPASKWESVVADRISDLMRLPIGWDGYGGRPLTPGSAYIAVRLLATVCTPGTPPPSLVPLPGGGVQIEWHRGAIDLEISVFSPGRISVFYCDDRSDDDGQEIDIVADYSQIIRLVHELNRAG